MAPIAGLVLGHLISRGHTAAKIKDVLSIAAGVLLVALVIYQIDGAAFYAVFSHFGRVRNSIIDTPHILLAGGLAFLVAAGYLVSGKRLFDERISHAARVFTYSIPLLAWLLGCVAGAMNMGGNVGNSAVGVVLALPLLGLLFDSIKPWMVSLVLIAITLYCSASMVRSKWMPHYEARLAVEAQISQRIIATGSKIALISGDSYMAVRRARLDRISEIDVWTHLNAGINKIKAIPDANALLDSVRPDVIVCVQGCAVFSEVYSFTPGSKGYVEIPLASTRTPGVMYVRQALAHQ